MMKLINLTSLGGACAPKELHTRLYPEQGSWGRVGAPLRPSPGCQGGTENQGEREFLLPERFCWFSLLKNYLNISNVIPSHT